ncbi:MAG: ATP-binding cassette domain-containing protein [Phycisphaerales bacterium]|nr:ATP-binding cassette domain-containing protein [Phycisphaerales bacterium]
MIEIDHLTKCYGSFRAVGDVTLSIPDGQVLGLLGPNGAGKTTMIRVMTGYLPPTSGRASVEGFDSVTQSHEVRRRLGYLPESNPLYGEMRVVEYLDFRGRIFGLAREARRKAVDRVVERCWLKEMRRRQIGRLSKGYRQRVGLAAAMLHQPPVLVLDEPTSGLDPIQIRETRHLIRELAGDHTMVLSSHILPEVEVTCDRIVIIARGGIRADGTVDQLKHKAGDSQHYVLEVKPAAGANGSIREAIGRISGVSRVDETNIDGWTRYEITGGASAVDLREPLGRLVAESALPCRELHRESGSLEQLFVRITSEVDAS